MTLLSKEERTSIVNSHKKNLAMNEYNIDVSIIEENAKTTPDTYILATLNASIAAIANQQLALDEELASIAAEVTP
jgi:hypothetical protein